MWCYPLHLSCVIIPWLTSYFLIFCRSCLYAFKYEGHASIARKVQSAKEMEEQLQQNAPPTGKEKGGGKKTSSAAIVSSPLSSVQTAKTVAAARSTVSSKCCVLAVSCVTLCDAS